MAAHDRQSPAACRRRELATPPQRSALPRSNGALLKLSQSGAFSSKHSLTLVGPARKPPRRSILASPRPGHRPLGLAAIEAPEEVTPMSNLPPVSQDRVSRKPTRSAVAHPLSFPFAAAAARLDTKRRTHHLRRKVTS